MTTLKTKDVQRNLCKKGFIKYEGDHTYFALIVNNKKTTIRTKISHGSKEIGDSLILQMAIQLRLNKKDFLDFVSCKLSEDDYLKIIKL